MTENATTEPQVTKRRVEMGHAAGSPLAVDYIHPEHVDAYVADARTRWEFVEVADEPDAGPGGYDGEYTLPAHLDHPDAGVTRPATPGSETERLLAESRATQEG